RRPRRGWPGWPPARWLHSRARRWCGPLPRRTTWSSLHPPWRGFRRPRVSAGSPAVSSRRAVAIVSAYHRCSAMRRIKIEHSTTYEYPEPVRFLKHRLLVRPREGHDIRIESSRLDISPKYSIRWHRDVYGNSVAAVDFHEP